MEKDWGYVLRVLHDTGCSVLGVGGSVKISYEFRVNELEMKRHLFPRETSSPQDFLLRDTPAHSNLEGDSLPWPPFPVTAKSSCLCSVIDATVDTCSPI